MSNRWAEPARAEAAGRFSLSLHWPEGWRVFDCRRIDADDRSDILRHLTRQAELRALPDAG